MLPALGAAFGVAQGLYGLYSGRKQASREKQAIEEMKQANIKGINARWEDYFKQLGQQRSDYLEQNKVSSTLGTGMEGGFGQANQSTINREAEDLRVSGQNRRAMEIGLVNTGANIESSQVQTPSIFGGLLNSAAMGLNNYGALGGTLGGDDEVQDQGAWGTTRGNSPVSYRNTPEIVPSAPNYFDFYGQPTKRFSDYFKTKRFNL